jgi:hypothetical protein
MIYKKPFAQFVKKSRKPLQLAIEDQVGKICCEPAVGTVKTGDLHGVFVYKFKFHYQEYLIAYRFGNRPADFELLWIDFYKVGSHENFYEELKRFIRQACPTKTEWPIPKGDKE